MRGKCEAEAEVEAQAEEALRPCCRERPAQQQERALTQVAPHFNFMARSPSRVVLWPVFTRCATMNAAEREIEAWQWHSTQPPRASVSAMARETRSKSFFASPAQRLSGSTFALVQLDVVALPASNCLRSSGSSSSPSISITSTPSPKKPGRASHWHTALFTTRTGPQLGPSTAISFSRESTSW